MISSKSMEKEIEQAILDWKGLETEARHEGFDELISVWGVAAALTAMEKLFGEEISLVVDGVCEATCILPKRKDIKTIATYYHRLYNGGTESIVSQLAKIWSESGYKVIVITDEAPNQLDYMLPEGTVREILPRYVAGDFEERSVRIEKICQDYNIDAFVSHAWSAPSLLWDVLTVKAMGVPFISYAHGAASSMALLNDKHLLTLPKIYQLIDSVLTLSGSDSFYWSLYSGCVIKIIDPVPIAIPDEDLPDTKLPNLLWIGRIEPHKNFRDLLSVITRVKEVFPEVRLQVVGGEEEGTGHIERFQKDINERGLSSNIELCGYQTDIISFYKNAAVFIMTSLTESFSLTLLESKVLGLPCVAYDIPYLDMFRDGEGMFIVPQYDTEAMAAKITKLLMDDQLSKEMGEGARTSSRKYTEFDHHLFWESLFKGLKERKKNTIKSDVKDAQLFIESLFTNSINKEDTIRAEYNAKYWEYDDGKGPRLLVKAYRTAFIQTLLKPIKFLGNKKKGNH